MYARPGGGWPGDPATARTPVAQDAGGVRDLAGARSLPVLDARVSVCRACPRLVQWREEVAATRRRAYADQPYWGRPVPGFGVADPRILIVGLAPGAHGANRTGRNFTGDRSGDWLYAALHRAGLANQPTSTAADDGLQLFGTRIVAAVRCAPPDNKPTPAERDTCRPWLSQEIALTWPSVRAVVVLGGFGWSALWPALRDSGVPVPAPLPAFAHGARVALGDGRIVLGCYHVSQQNTQTGRLHRTDAGRRDRSGSDRGGYRECVRPSRWLTRRSRRRWSRWSLWPRHRATTSNDDDVIQSAHPQVVGLAQQLRARTVTDTEFARSAYEWVRDEVAHSWDAQDKRVTLSAVDVLEQRVGLCFAKSHLYAALLRSEGIPAGLCYQRLGSEEEGHVLHGLVAVYLEGAWHRLDVRGNNDRVNAQFTLARRTTGLADQSLPTVSVITRWSTRLLRLRSSRRFPRLTMLSRSV